MREVFDAMSVRAKSPDGRVTGELRGRCATNIGFVNPDSYYEYSMESDLAVQLRLVMDALLNGQREAQQMALHEKTQLRVSERTHWRTGVRKFREEHDEITALGDSEGGYVSISFTGLTEAEVVVAPGTFDALEVDEFLTEVDSAIENLWDDWFDQLRDLQRRHWHGGKVLCLIGLQ